MFRRLTRLFPPRREGSDATGCRSVRVRHGTIPDQVQVPPDQELPDQELPDHEFPDQLLPDHEFPDHEFPDQLLPFQMPPDQEVPAAWADRKSVV